MLHDLVSFLYFTSFCFCYSLAHPTHPTLFYLPSKLFKLYRLCLSWSLWRMPTLDVNSKWVTQNTCLKWHSATLYTVMLWLAFMTTSWLSSKQAQGTEKALSIHSFIQGPVHKGAQLILDIVQWFVLIKIRKSYLNKPNSWKPVVHECNPTGSKSIQANSLQDPISRKPNTKMGSSSGSSARVPA
jgi:hypothetical protein